MNWIRMADRLPPDRTFVLLRGPSGYRTVPHFVILGQRDMQFRPPMDDGRIRWLDPTNEPLMDRGWEPTEWCPLPERDGKHEIAMKYSIAFGHAQVYVWARKLPGETWARCGEFTLDAEEARPLMNLLGLLICVEEMP